MDRLFDRVLQYRFVGQIDQNKHCFTPFYSQWWLQRPHCYMQVPCIYIETHLLVVCQWYLYLCQKLAKLIMCINDVD